jgi:hypothetical protein
MLVYDTTTTLTIDDRVLAHLQVVIINKLRRNESFAFTWRESGRDSVCWMAPAIALEFVYWDDDHPSLNRKWLEQLAAAAYANPGLKIMPEPADL